MSIYVILGTPGAFDFQAFSETTRRSLALLAPVTELRHSNSQFANDIAAQAMEYVQAIKLGVGAAQRGFTATEDIISLAGLVASTTPEERAEYLVGTLELADQAYAEGKEAFQAFRDVRTKVYTLTDKFNSTLQSTPTVPRFRTRAQADAANRSIEDLRRGVDILADFGSQASALAQWWDWIKVETDVHRKGQSTVAFDDSSLRQQAIIDRWKLLRTQFADYTNMVGQLEDTYPEILSRDGVETAPGQAPRTQTSRAARLSNFRPDLRRALNITRRGRDVGNRCCWIV
ncbi:hypothetical protein GALMADRAFT_224421 [Galerina marginata CBS 339.88]|uniref:Uncharacterized protein n=1 Tax=Galerina marginata (strain CBS 339.88) TaxID=685588 RepID=A0A067T6R4_GALM3|nr:hypothetical protein GALMADRAFT_224421 [Galerina marginata CBS 339.88]